MNKKRKQTNKEAYKEIEIPSNLQSFAKYLNHLKKISKVIFIFLILIILTTLAQYSLLTDTMANSVENKQLSTTQLLHYSAVIRSKFNKQLENEVEKYIKSVAPTSKINSDLLVTTCKKYNLNITFVLSQGLLESHFGTRGKCVTTNSIFNVGSWDEGQVLYRYKNVNESIEPYMKLIKTKYLVNKELDELIKDHGYKDINGCRYATSLNYEKRIRKLMSDINTKTSIQLYQDAINLSDEKLLSFFANDTSKQFTYIAQK